ncbi:flagellar transcriptional regulator FlhD [Methylomonas sp. MK1]|uniref:flagellar transcriptional regulator FlhD n=1 Tax=Methylomonas sp. MK1 TaxID=1131552 RepID=UPI000368A5FF|nr:flagellar transcriptional regulator FlhD [Methylomonas sp. MK1]
MDENLYKLNLDYLIVAQSLIFSGSEQKAMFCLGLTNEAVSLLRKMPLAQLKSLARSDCLTFVPRFNPHKWSKFLNVEKNEDPNALDARTIDLLMLLSAHPPES